MNKITIMFLIILVIAFLFSNYIDIYKDYTVSEVIDGDTFKTTDGKDVRLIGINAPEVGEKCYQEAKDGLKELIYRKEIRLESDVGDKDTYGRILRYAYIDKLFVNADMIRLGLARFEEVQPNTKYSSLFSDLEEKARKAGRCIWE